MIAPVERIYLIAQAKLDNNLERRIFIARDHCVGTNLTNSVKRLQGVDDLQPSDGLNVKARCRLTIEAQRKCAREVARVAPAFHHLHLALGSISQL